MNNMKKIKAILMTLTFGILISAGVMAQGPPPPPIDPNSGGNQTPGGPGTSAPIDNGTAILLILAAGYGLTKVNKFRGKLV